MKIVLFIPLVVLFFGCHEINQMVETTTALSQTKKEEKSFHTNLQRFEEEFQNIKNKEDRNKLIDQLITASNMECNAYQYNMTQEDESKTDSVYTYMFKTVGKYIGWDIAKDAIDAVSALSDAGQERSNQEKYTQALKPNIIKAIQISRKKYLQKILEHKKLDLQAYPPSKVKEDLHNYDKRCSTYYGLMEITNALEKQNDEASSINVDEVKTKIKEVTEEVKTELKDINNTQINQ
jgi:hypothetical protein